MKESGGAGGRSVGSLVVGVNELFRDGLGAVGARSSVPCEQRLPSRRHALRAIHLATVLVILALTLAALQVERWFIIGLVLVGLVTFLQNVRRPIFVSTLNEIVNKPLRATILSIDNQATSVAAAASMPIAGFAADHWGLWTTCAISGLVMLTGLVRQRPESGANR